jgi:Flp pilus assembly protein TadG
MYDEQTPDAPSRRRAGVALTMGIVMMIAVMAFVSLAVDMGRVQTAKTELRGAADAAARYGVVGLADGTAGAKAISAAADNSVDGASLKLLTGDVQIGTWNSATKAFTVTGMSPNAIRVVAQRAQSRGTGIPLIFAMAIGRSTVDLTATSVATYRPAATINTWVPAMGDPWLAGMPNGTTANSYDSAPNDSPGQVSTTLALVAGATLNFTISGIASINGGTSNSAGADGDSTRISYNNYPSAISTGREHGMSNLSAPLGCVMGVFLDAIEPDMDGALPSDLDFTAAASRDFSSLSPAVRQPFFIGDARQASGTLQSFVVPTGATRLYLGIMDGRQWSNNTGSFTANSAQVALTTIVK